MKTVRNCQKKNAAYWQCAHDSLIRSTADPLNMQCRRLARYEHMVKANPVLVDLD
jgi:hypothetical protein